MVRSNVNGNNRVNVPPFKTFYWEPRRRGLGRLFDVITGREKRDYEIAYNNYTAEMAERDRILSSLEHNADVYDELGLDLSTLAGVQEQSAVAGSLDEPEYSNPLDALTATASASIGLLNGGNNVVSGIVKNIIDSAGVPQARLNRALDKFKNDLFLSDGKLDTGSPIAQTIMKSVDNDLQSANNEGDQLALQTFKTAFERAGFNRFTDYDDDGNWSFNDEGLDHAYELFDASYQDHIDARRARDDAHNESLNRQDDYAHTKERRPAKDSFEDYVMAFTKEMNALQKDMTEEQLKAFRSSHYLDGFIADLDIPDAFKGVLMVLVKASSAFALGASAGAGASLGKGIFMP